MTTTRSHPVPCRGATLQESIRGTHKTWADDAYCDRCRVLNTRSQQRVREQLAARASRQARGEGPVGATPAAPTGPSLAPATPGNGAGRGRVPAGSPSPASSRGLPL